MIVPPQSVKGTADKPITVRAEHDGKVTLNATGGFAVLLGNNDGSGNAYMVIEGINAHHGGEALIRVRGSNNTLRRVIGWDGTSGQDNSNIFNITGQEQLVRGLRGLGEQQPQDYEYVAVRQLRRRGIFAFLGRVERSPAGRQQSQQYLAGLLRHRQRPLLQYPRDMERTRACRQC